MNLPNKKQLIYLLIVGIAVVSTVFSIEETIGCKF